ncbi:MAG: isoleucyl-tRNA synthetase [Gammaproteobacteria bacterium]
MHARAGFRGVFFSRAGKGEWAEFEDVAMSFDEVTGRYNGPNLEQAMLTLWRERDVFARLMANGNERELYTWNDGPPTANGKPGIHHVLARTFKDLYPRYKTMRGYHCPRKAGWDTHGLPVEHEVEKELGIFDKSRIEAEVGVDEFTRRCRESVMRYIADWERMTERMGFWVDMKDAYYTLDNDYIESVWHLLNVIWDKGLMYQGYKVVPYDPRIGATLSSHEVAQGYKEIVDPSVYVRFPLIEEENTSFLVWTTTPWTLPSNLALAVAADVDYAFARTGNETLVLASELLDAALGDASYEVVRTVKGADLLGSRYRRPFDYLSVDAENAWQVHAAEFVTTEDGTGIVHIAPAYGVDDLALGQQAGLPVVHGVGLDGNFLPEVTPVAGIFFKDADPVLVDELKKNGTLWRKQDYRHNYPHGWRTGDPLIYYAKHAWYIRTSALRDRMVELNNTINWVPENIREGRFGNWLENNIDWALSRERFWGTPLPVWTDGDGDFMCIGSLEQLEGLCGRELRDVDLHRPAIDGITFVHPDNGREYRRVPEVIDCWFDSGAMSYAQWHYPFENADTFDKHFPADYIVEAIDQTRGWFYTLHAISTLVSDSVAYKNVICLAHIVDQNGKKMSKSVGNIVDPYDVFDSVGADALRWYFVARVAPDVQKRVSVDIVRDVASSFINTLWNTYGFFTMYARLDSPDLSRDIPVAERPETDRWILALLHDTVRKVTDSLDRYDALNAGRHIEAFVDALSNWYVRLNRRRFWKAVAGDDKQAAYLTLYECLDVVQRLFAPIMPFIAESMYQNLVRNVDPHAPDSIHMCDWPLVDESRRDEVLLAEFSVVRTVVSLGRAARNQSGLRTRQPLARVLVRTPDDLAQAAVERHESMILEELNVKAVESVARDAQLVSYRLKPNLPRIGKRYGKLIPAIRKALGDADGAAIAIAVAAGESFTLEAAGESLLFDPQDVLVETQSAQGYACAEESGYLVGLDTSLTADLVREGLVRELVRTVQEARKQAGLEVSDRITLRVWGSIGVDAALDAFKAHLMDETLASQWADEKFVGIYSAEHELDGENWHITLSQAAP